MPDNQWLNISFDSLGNEQPKPHILPERLAEAVVADMTSRGYSVSEEILVSRVSLDLGGMWHRNQPTEELAFDGLVYSFPSIDAKRLLDLLERAPARTHTVDNVGWVFHKIHGQFLCFVFDAGQRAGALEILRDISDTALARGQNFQREMADRLAALPARDR